MESYIIEQLKQGDEKAFKYIYDRHYALLCRFAYQLLGDAPLAEEVVGDVIFYLWEHRAEIDIVCSLRAYLLRAVRNRCLNELNSLRSRMECRLSSLAQPESMELLEALFVEEKHPLGVLLEQELETKLADCIEELAPECRAVFKKSRMEQKKYEEIAGELGISVNTVKYHMKNALTILHAKLGEYLRLLICFFFLGN